MSNTHHFNGLVQKGNAVGEIIAVDKFLVKIKGLQPCTIHTLVMFEDGSKGLSDLTKKTTEGFHANRRLSWRNGAVQGAGRHAWMVGFYLRAIASGCCPKNPVESGFLRHSPLGMTGTRTRTPFRAANFKSAVSTDSTIIPLA